MMRIAIQNSWPNVPQSAENEFIARALLVCQRVGFDAVEVVTSDDILRFKPDCVLVTHEYSPKLTPFPTLGLLWSPCSFYAYDPLRHKSILSYDGWLCGSGEIAEWLQDFLVSKGRQPLIHSHLFLPSAPDCGPAGNLPSELTLMYVGRHWDGTRHGAIFRSLGERVQMNIYGSAESWPHVGDSYRGMLPCDGRSLIEAIRSSGIALCLHKVAHRKYNCPSMRLFEAAAAGALIISDDFAFPRQWFRDSVLYVDPQLPASLVTEQVVAHVEWARANQEAATRLARRSNELFRRALTLDRMFDSLPPFVDRVRERSRMVVAPNTVHNHATVEYIIRVGSRSVGMVCRALDCLATQTHRGIAITIIQFHPVEGLDALLAQHHANFRRIRRLVVPNDDKRSTAWWAGLKSVEAEFFAVLDDDDLLHPNHIASIMDYFEHHPDCGFVYSGTIRTEEEPGFFVNRVNFDGPSGKTIEETREVVFLDEPDLVRLAYFDNFIQSNSWICRTAVLDQDLLFDPMTEYSEDMYFYLLVASRTKLGFTGSPTAVWNWRSQSKDNSMLSFDTSKLMAGLGRIRMRLRIANLQAKVPIEVVPPKYEEFLDAVKQDNS
jgi:phosphoglycerol transferase